MKNKYSSIKSALELIRNTPDTNVTSVILAADGNYEESVLIGTQDSYIHMAIKFLEIAQAVSGTLDFDEDDIDGQKFLYTNEIKYVFDEHGDVWPVCSYLANDEIEMAILKKYYTKE
jgi:hypothetical protein